MGKVYTQISMEERCEIPRLCAQGSSVRQIAAGVDRPPSTLARELKRNGSRTSGPSDCSQVASTKANIRSWKNSSSPATETPRTAHFSRSSESMI